MKVLTLWKFSSRSVHFSSRIVYLNEMFLVSNKTTFPWLHFSPPAAFLPFTVKCKKAVSNLSPLIFSRTRSNQTVTLPISWTWGLTSSPGTFLCWTQHQLACLSYSAWQSPVRAWDTTDYSHQEIFAALGFQDTLLQIFHLSSCSKNKKRCFNNIVNRQYSDKNFFKCFREVTMQ